MESLNNLLVIVLIFLVFSIIILTFAYVVATLKQKKSNTNDNLTTETKKSKSQTKQNYNIKSVFDFMEFEKVEDNMIIQKKGKKFLMAVECQGINFDLMSEVEMASVESGFMQFLNTLREPIQIYIQSRTVNLEQNLIKYKSKINDIENELRRKQSEYKLMLDNPNVSQHQIDMQKMDIVREKNLLEYGKDIVANTERMSFNKNILRKKYYLILSYYYSENNEEGFFDFSEIKELAFSELYTKAQTIIRSLAPTGVVGHVANSYELVDLLYNAYNKDESDTFGIDKAIMGGFDALYVTAQDVFDKKIKALDKKIENDATVLAERALVRAKTRLEKLAEEKEEKLEELISNLAKELLDENEEILGNDLTEFAKEDVDNIQKEEREGKKNGKKVKTN